MQNGAFQRWRRMQHSKALVICKEWVAFHNGRWIIKMTSLLCRMEDGLHSTQSFLHAHTPKRYKPKRYKQNEHKNRQLAITCYNFKSVVVTGITTKIP